MLNDLTDDWSVYIKDYLYNCRAAYSHTWQQQLSWIERWLVWKSWICILVPVAFWLKTMEVYCMRVFVWGERGPKQMDPPAVWVSHYWSSHMSDEGQLRRAAMQTRGRTGGHRVGKVYRWARLSSYPQLLFDFEMHVVFNHSPSPLASQPKQTVTVFVWVYLAILKLTPKN